MIKKTLGLVCVAISLLATTPGRGVWDGRNSVPVTTASYAQLPLTLEPNVGQAHEGVKFVSRGSGYALLLSPAEALLALRGAEAKAAVLVRMQMVGADPAARVEGLEPQPSRSNYYLGNDSKRWLSGVPQFGKVRYREVWPGVDLVFYGNQRQLEYDLVLKAGTNPSVIRFAFPGIGGLRVDSEGDLLLRTPAGEIRQTKPLVYQDVQGTRKYVDGRYALLGRGQVAFRLARFDATRDLVIDPVLSYSTLLGGTGEDKGNAIAVDGSGNAYITGTTVSADFPVVGGQTSANATLGDVFVAKISANGTSLLYSTYMGGSAQDFGNAIALDGSGNVYVAGSTASNNFPVLNAFQAQRAGFADAFVAKLNSAGVLQYSTYLGGVNEDIAYGIAADSSGNAYVAGKTQSTTDFPRVSPLQNTYGGGVDDAFVTKLNPSGTPVYSTFLGGSTSDTARAIAVDGTGAAYVTGITFGSFPTLGAFQPSAGGGADAFVTKINPAGNALVYSSYFGGAGAEEAYGIAVDRSSGAAYIAGSAASSGLASVGAVQGSLGGGTDAFVIKVNPSGNSLAYSTYVGGNQNDAATAIDIDGSGNAYITGVTRSPNFPSVNAFQGPPATLDGTPSAPPVAFVTQLNASGTAFGYSSHLGGTGTQVGAGIAVHGSDAYVTGYASGAFPTTPGAYQVAAKGTDAFVAKVGNPPVPSEALLFVPVAPCRVVDTRLAQGIFGGPVIAGGTSRDFPIPTGPCPGIPADAVAYSLNVTVQPVQPLGYLTIWPTGQVQPYVSTLNSHDGRIKANAALVPAGTGGSVSVFASNATHVVLDINGYFVPAASPAPGALAFYPVSPCRVADTRQGTGMFGAPFMPGGSTRDFVIPSSACNLPLTAKAYSLNFTVVPKGGLGFLTTWPTGVSRPWVSTLNAPTGVTTANAAIVPSSAAGSISVFVTNPTDLVLDINGYFAPPGGLGALSFYALSPCRIADTRNPAGPFGGPSLAGGGPRDFDITSSNCGALSTAKAYSLNATVVPQTTLGFLTLWPSGVTMPVASTLNSVDGTVTSNAAIVPTSSGPISAFGSNATDLVLDINGFFAP